MLLVSSEVFLLSKDFVLLVIVANVFAWPLAWFAMSKWLQTFAYRIDMDPLFFISAAAISLMIAFGTISIQSIKAALADPVNSLRNE